MIFCIQLIEIIFSLLLTSKALLVFCIQFIYPNYIVIT